MRVLVDNTLIHRVGTMLEAEPGSTVSPVDLLAIFHFAEHILFAEHLTVSAFERPETAERTAKVIDLLEHRGLSGERGEGTFITHDSFTAEEYEDACDKASAAIQDELEELSPVDLRKLGAFADEAARPTGLPPFPFHKWASQTFQEIGQRQSVEALLNLRATGAFALTLSKNEALHARIRALNADAAVFDSRQSAALTVIFRLKINQELARSRFALYAPAPQRARVSQRCDQLFRYRLEAMIDKIVSERQNRDDRGVVKHLRSLEALPLPAFALHFLRQSAIQSPNALLEAAWSLRNDKKVREVRDWLTNWERRMRSESPEERLSALQAIDFWAAELGGLLSADDRSVLASVNPGVNVEIDPLTGVPSLSADIGGLAKPLARLLRRFSKERRFLAAVSTELATDSELGTFLVRATKRSLSTSPSKP